MRYILFTVLSLLIFSCKSKEKIVDQSNTVEEQTNTSESWGNLKLTYSRGACFGTCPVFVMEVYDNGFAKLNGKQYVDKRGLWHLELSPAQKQNFMEAFKKADLLNKDPEYKSNIPDLPRVTFIQHDGSNETRVTGKENMPEELKALAKTLDQIIKSNQWVAIDGELVKQDDPNVNLDEILVQFKANTTLPVWFQDKKTMGIWLKERVSEENNSWIIGYKRSEYKPDEILKLLKKDKGIKSAEFNKKVQNR